MKTARIFTVSLLTCLATTSSGQENRTPDSILAEASRFGDIVEVQESDVISNVLPDENPDAIGLLPSYVSDLPTDLWADSETSVLVGLVSAQSADVVASAQDLLYRLLLAEAEPPQDSSGDGQLYLARIDKIVEFGALQPARELLQRGRLQKREFFSRWFDISVLTRSEHKSCSALNQNRWLAPSVSALVFCLLRLGDWKEADFLYRMSLATGVLPEQETNALAKLLQPEEAIDVSAKILAAHSPLEFRILVDSGYDVAANDLLNSYGYLYLQSGTVWRTRTAVAERLARNGVIPFERLLVVYAEHTPPASGAPWQRVQMITDVDASINAGDRQQAVKKFVQGFELARDLGLEVQFSRYFVPRLAKLQVDLHQDREFAIPVLLARRLPGQLSLIREHLWKDAARRAVFDLAHDLIPSGNPLAASIHAGLSQPLGAGHLKDLIEKQRIGEALLNVVLKVQDIGESDPARVRDALAALNQMGMSDLASQIALQALVKAGAL